MNGLTEKIYSNKIQCLFYFLTFLFIPAVIPLLIKNIYIAFFDSKSYLNNNFYNFLSDNLFFVIIQFIIFFIFFIIAGKINSEIFSFLNNENWFITFNKSLFPAVIAYGVGFLITLIFNISMTFSLNYLEKFYIISEEFKYWITAPNQGAIDLLEYLKNKNYIKTVIYLTYIVIFVPVYEEFCFRGFLFDFINKHVKRKNWDIILVSLIFALFHIFSFLNTVFAFIMSLFITKARKDTGSINISIWMHAIINFTMITSGIIYYFLSLNRF